MLGMLAVLFLGGTDLSKLTVDTSVAHATTTADLIALATSSAAKYGLTAKQTVQMLKVVNCESGWDNDAVGPMKEIGLIQFYPPAHKDLTREQMTDVYFELGWMAARFAAGETEHWVCYRLLFG